MRTSNFIMQRDLLSSLLLLSKIKQLASAMDEPDLILEWGIATIVDPQEKLLDKLCHIFYVVCGIKWLSMYGTYWDNYDDFVKDVTNQTISYAQDCDKG